MKKATDDIANWRLLYHSQFFGWLFRLVLLLNFFGGVHVVGIRFRIMFRRVETT